MILYHGSKEVVEYPEIRKARFNKDFYFGFYCTNIEKQAERWAIRYTCILIHCQIRPPEYHIAL